VIAMTKKRKPDDTDELLLRRFQRAYADFQHSFRTGAAPAGAKTASRRSARQLPKDEHKCALAILSELNVVLKLMIARKDDVGRQLNRAQGHRAAASAYARMGALAGVMKRNI
jgi:hypothetical protein